MPPGTTVPPEEARSQRRGLRSLVGSCGRVGPPVQVGQRTRSECRGVLNVVLVVSAIRARLVPTSAVLGRLLGYTIRCLSDPDSDTTTRLRPRKTRAFCAQFGSFASRAAATVHPKKKNKKEKKRRKRKEEEEKQHTRKQASA